MEDNSKRYLREVARISPPKNSHDQFMIEVYQHLLDKQRKQNKQRSS